MQFEIIQGTADRKNDLFKLFELAFGRSKDPGEYQWMYERGMHGYPLVFFARDKETGDYAGAKTTFIRNIKVFDKVEQALGGHDHMVNPNFQRNGIYKKLLMASAEVYKQRGIKFWLSFPNDKSWGAFKKYTRNGEWDYHDVGHFYRFVRVLDYSSVLPKRLRVIKPLVRLFDRINNRIQGMRLAGRGSIRVEVVDHFDDSIEAVWTHSQKHYNVINDRSMAYLNWRYIDNPKHYTFLKFQSEGTVQGYCIYKVSENVMTILDLLIDPEFQHVDQIVDALEAYSRSRSYSKILAVLPESNPYVPFFKKKNYVNRGLWGRFGVHRFGYCDERLLDESNWFITLGDVEHT